MKRELAFSEVPRPKRCKEAEPAEMPPALEPTVDVTGNDDEGLRERALQLWQTVRDATNKEGRIMSIDFLRQPPRKHYPDYYVLIAHPIALEDIRKKIEDGGYDSLEAVRQDFELCFKNAKQYNQKESDIWRDAKELQKLANKTYNKMIPHEDGEDGAKSKPPSMNRLLKARLQKLVDKADDSSGRILSTEFMELPNKKQWAIYYKIIKRPMCIENIFRKLKRKDYETSAEFAADVELVFSNATTFNQEHTPIWEDAVILRDYFAQLMSDLPAAHALPQYAKPSATKLKLKVPPMNHAALHNGNTSPPQAAASTSKSVLLRVPAPSAPPAPVQQQAAPSPAPPPPAALPIPAQITSVPPASPKPPTPPQPRVQAQPITLTPTIIPTTAEPAKQLAAAAAASQPVRTATASPATAALPHLQPQATPQPSKSPNPENKHSFKFIQLKIEPSNRMIGLDHQDGVTTWVTRLAPGEKSVKTSRIVFLEEEGDDASDGEQEDEEGEDAEPVMKIARKRGRPPKVKKPAPKPVKSKKRKPAASIDDVRVKLNGQAKPTPDSKVWTLDLASGWNIIEVTEKGGAAWHIHMERTS
ncbi:Bromodomain-containing protein [Pleurotus eryngii]|uniref:Bromodomain-containing protein n=1 Tax=Pleurotus eryngii TaxID=5323 RepID=A0A9P6A8Y3_PLEER|nr:Bromodomain-containing protein [Pleurotus eryngii]